MCVCVCVCVCVRERVRVCVCACVCPAVAQLALLSGCVVLVDMIGSCLKGFRDLKVVSILLQIDFLS